MATSAKLGVLTREGQDALQAFPRPKPDSDEFYISGLARRVSDPSTAAPALAAAKHPVRPDEVPFELLIERVTYTKWEGFGNPGYHPVHEKSGAPASNPQD